LTKKSENWIGVHDSIAAANQWFGSQMFNSTYYRNITLGNRVAARAKVVNSLSFA